MTDFHRVYRIGDAPTYDGAPRKSVWIAATFADGRLSIRGVHGPKSNGDCFGSAGQIVDVLPAVDRFADGWDRARVDELAAIWRRWHLNDCRAGSPRQEAHLRDGRYLTGPYDRMTGSGSHYAWACVELERAGLNPDVEHDGYRYGSAWLVEEVPHDVLARLVSFPEAPEPCPGPWFDL